MSEPTSHRWAPAVYAVQVGGEAGRALVANAQAIAGGDVVRLALGQLLNTLRNRDHGLEWRLACATAAVEELLKISEEGET